jgi:pimeloyl-ACP methyl ester carboxylesterase
MTNPHRVSHHSGSVDGIRIRYAKAGEGPALVLLHRFPQSGRAWRRIIQNFSENYTVIAPDLRGFGDTDRPSAGYDKRTVAQDVYELVQQHPFQLASKDLIEMP